MKKIFITGANGFIGAHLCEELSELGYEVYGLIRNPKNTKGKKDYSFTSLKGDLSSSSLQSVISQLPQDLDTVIHTAGIAHSFKTKYFDDINYKGTVFLFNELQKKYPQLHFLFISSLAAVGPSQYEKPHTEKTPLNPTSRYGLSKKKAEVFLKESQPKNWQITIIRPPMVIGPHDPAMLDVFKMVQSKLILASGRNGLKKMYSFICIYDLCELIREAAQKERKQGEISLFLPAYPLPASYQEIINEIKKVMKNSRTLTLCVPLFFMKALAQIMNFLQRITSFNFRLTPDKIHELSPNFWVVDSSLSQRELGMSYKWDLKKTISITYKDYKERGLLSD